MHLLYPSAPDRSNAVDELFAEEYDAARSAGLACSLFCDEELESGRFRARPEFPANTQVLYRGWMLTPENYARLHGAILVAGGRPLTSPQQYRHCHYLPEWYPLCEDLTPATLFLSRNADFEAVLAQSPWRAWFVKDHVKSLTTQRGSKATNAAEVREVLDSIERYQCVRHHRRRCMPSGVRGAACGNRGTLLRSSRPRSRASRCRPAASGTGGTTYRLPVLFRRRGRVDQWRVAPDGTRRWPGLRPQAMARRTLRGDAGTGIVGTAAIPTRPSSP